MTTGEKLQKLRKSNNITQEQLSEILNVSRQSISKWESDLAFPETDKLIALAKIYHCSVDYLLNIDNNQNIQSNEQSGESAPQKKEYNKKKLPLLICSCFVVFLTFIFFALTWVGAYDSEKSVMVLFNFYQLIFNIHDQTMTPLALSIFALNFVITGLCISYFFVDKLILNVLIRMAFIIEVFLLFILKDWATIPSPLVIYSGCRVQIGICISLIAVQFILLFVTKEFSDYKYTAEFRKNVFVFSTLSMFVLFIVIGNVPLVYRVARSAKELFYYNGQLVDIGYVHTFFTFTFECLSGGGLIPSFTIILLFLAILILTSIYIFKTTGIIKIAILVSTCLLTFVLLLTSMFLGPSALYGDYFKSTFVWILTILMIGLVITQFVCMHYDKKALKAQHA